MSSIFIHPLKSLSEFISDNLLKNNREIIICECDYQLAGVAIIKNDNIE